MLIWHGMTVLLCFQIHNIQVEKVVFHDPKRTEQESYKDDFRVNLYATPCYICLLQGAELAADWLQQSILSP